MINLKNPQIRCFDNCTRCYSILYCETCITTFTRQQNNTCVCTAGRSLDISTKRCVTCNANCKSCYGVTPNECLDCRPNQFLSVVKTCDCKPGFTLAGNDCVCDPLKFIDNSIPGSETCLNCDPSCSSCSNSATNCTSCPALKILHQGACLDSCPQNDFFYSSQFNKCAPCESSCSKCSLASTNC